MTASVRALTVLRGVTLGLEGKAKRKSAAEVCTVASGSTPAPEAISSDPKLAKILADLIAAGHDYQIAIAAATARRAAGDDPIQDGSNAFKAAPSGTATLRRRDISPDDAAGLLLRFINESERWSGTAYAGYLISGPQSERMRARFGGEVRIAVPLVLSVDFKGVYQRLEKERRPGDVAVLLSVKVVSGVRIDPVASGWVLSGGGRWFSIREGANVIPEATSPLTIVRLEEDPDGSAATSNGDNPATDVQPPPIGNDSAMSLLLGEVPIGEGYELRDFDGLTRVIESVWRRACPPGSNWRGLLARYGRIPAVIRSTLEMGPKEEKATAAFSSSRAERIAVTESVAATNYGTLARACGQGDFVRVSDGPGCGKRRHEDAEKASGAIWSLDTAASYPSAHPFCRRSFTPLDLDNALASAASASSAVIGMSTSSYEGDPYMSGPLLRRMFMEFGKKNGWTDLSSRDALANTTAGTGALWEETRAALKMIQVPVADRPSFEWLFRMKDDDRVLYKELAADFDRAVFMINSIMHVRSLKSGGYPLYSPTGRIKVLSAFHSRGHFNPQTGEIGIAPGNGGWPALQTLIHEMGHVIEFHMTRRGSGDLPDYNPGHEFLRRRTAGEEARPMSEIVGNTGYASSEISRKDRFLDPYMGKDYSKYDGAAALATETLSMGLERLLLGDPIDFALRDPDHFDYIIGLLRGELAGQRARHRDNTPASSRVPGSQDAPKPAPKPVPAPAPAPKPEPVPAPKPAPEPVPAPKPEPEPKPKPKPAPKPKPEPKPKPAPKPKPEPKPKPKPAPKPKPVQPWKPVRETDAPSGTRPSWLPQSPLRPKKKPRSKKP